MSKNPAVVLAFAIWLVIGVFVGSRSVAVDVEAHDALLRRTAALVSTDEALQRDVLAARYGLLSHYDPLVQGSADLDVAAHDVVARANGAAGAAVLAAVADRRAAVEAFKPRNSTLSNSLRYLPVAVEGFDDVPGIDADVHAVAALAFAAYVARDDASAAAVHAAAQALSAKAQTLPSPQSEDAALLARHAARVADDAVALQPQLAAVLSPTVATAAQQLLAEAQTRFRAEQSAAQRWRTALWLWSALTFGFAVFVVRSLIALYATLESRVRLRTAELHDKNLALEKKEAQLKDALSQLVDLEGLVGAGLQARAIAADANAALENGDAAAAKKALASLLDDPV